MLHFDGLTPRHWIEKKIRTLQQRGGWATTHRRRVRFQFIAADALRNRPERAEALYLAIRQLLPERASALQAQGLLSTQPMDPRQALARYFPGEEVDLSMARFDAQQMPYLRQKMPLHQRMRQRSSAWWHRLLWGLD